MVNARTKLLKPREVSVCKQLAASNKADSQRALALLAIHNGDTQAKASESSGLTIGQVKYIVTRFRQLGMQALNLEQDTTETGPAVADSQAKPKKAKKKKEKDKTKKDKKKTKSKDKKEKKKDKKSKKKAKKTKKK